MTQEAKAGDVIVVQEKLDGTCVVIVREDHQLSAYGREGGLCSQSPNDNRRAFASWLEQNKPRFSWLAEGERLVCEWLPVAHGTHYDLPHEPFVILDLFEVDGAAVSLERLNQKLSATDFFQPALLHSGKAMSVEEALQRLGEAGFHGARDGAEGLMYRLERDGKLRQAAKYVLPNKVPGLYLSDHSGLPTVYNTWKKAVHYSPASVALLEGWLRRATQHLRSSQLILRGSLLLMQWCKQARVPEDVDYLVLGEFDAQAMVKLAKEIVACSDDTTQLTLRRTEIIWANSDFPGLRVHVTGSVNGGETQAFQVDFAFGDPLPHAPRVVGIMGIGEVLACTPETLFGWKLHGLTEFGRGRWRAKDLYDLYLMSDQLELNRDSLKEAIPLAFSSRGDALSKLDDFRLRDTWGQSISGQRKWRTFLKKNKLQLEFIQARQRVRELLRELDL
jgi:hypothetical protein